MHENRILSGTAGAGLLIVIMVVMRLAAQVPAAGGAPLPHYPIDSTALLVVDPFNDFLSISICS
jgi:hypothetical protein